MFNSGLDVWVNFQYNNFGKSTKLENTNELNLNIFD